MGFSGLILTQLMLFSWISFFFLSYNIAAKSLSLLTVEVNLQKTYRIFRVYFFYSLPIHSRKCESTVVSISLDTFKCFSPSNSAMIWTTHKKAAYNISTICGSFSFWNYVYQKKITPKKKSVCFSKSHLLKKSGYLQFKAAFVVKKDSPKVLTNDTEKNTSKQSILKNCDGYRLQRKTTHCLW